MSKIRYIVAMSLDGYIAGPNGEADWIVMDPDVNFAELWAQFDTLLMGGRTYDAAVSRLGKAALRGRKLVVVSRTLKPTDHPDLSVLAEPDRNQLQLLRKQSAKDVWLMGGAQLFRTLIELGEVDTVEVTVVPVLLGEGIKLIPPCNQRVTLKLTSHKTYSSGLVSLIYQVTH